MIARETDAGAVECLATAGLSAGDVRDWLQAEPGETTDFPADRRKFSTYWQKASRLLGRLPHKPRRSEGEHAAAVMDKSSSGPSSTTRTSCPGARRSPRW